MSIIDLIVCELLATKKLPFPRTITIEPVGNLCQLRCPLCPTGIQEMRQAPRIMTLETFRKILDKVPFIKILELYRSGEPFLNPDLTAMIRYAAARKVKVIVSTHFSFTTSDDFFEKVVESGLARLVVSLDGTSQQSYARYRVGGDYELVMANIEKLLAVKRKRRSPTPEIVWQFLVSRFNEHEIDTAREIAGSLQIKLDVRPMDLDDELPDVELADSLDERRARWLPANERYRADRYRGEYGYPLFPGICKDLFTRLVVTADGKVMPCCLTWDPNNIFGDLLQEPFENIWYGRKYLEARSRFLRRDFKPQVQSVCYRCNNFNAVPSLQDKLQLLISVYKKGIGYWRR